MVRKVASHLLVLMLLVTFCIKSVLCSYENLCPHIYKKVFRGYIPRGNLSAGVFEDVEDATDLTACVLSCCVKEKCNVAFMSDEKCYHIKCMKNSLCIPTFSFNAGSNEHVSMVLVKPTNNGSWKDVLQSEDTSAETLDKNFYKPYGESARFQNVFDMLDDSPYSRGLSCNVEEEDTCMSNEVCEPSDLKSRTGDCVCKEHFIRNNEGTCLLMSNDVLNVPDIITDKMFVGKASNETQPRKTLLLTAESKTVKLPDNEVTLVANVLPSPTADEKIQFEWTPLEQPKGSAAVKHQNGGQVQLTKLSEGLYTFKVTASSPDSYGEAFVNVTVLPPSRINKPPKIIITPGNQTIKLPNSAAVLDASSSTDDDGIVSWHWELQQGPLGYQPALKDSPTLQLYDLTKPGNYTFKLTVTDTDKTSSSSTANITVLKNTDYPPEANAGEDKVIYLPHNSITLSGNLSTDDHAITTWEWTKSSDDAQKAVDMQDTRTPFLKLSTLEEGIYTFTLKVTDSANQSSTAQVHVFVKPPTNMPPVANAGSNLTVSLPQTWILLDGANSTDDNKIVKYNWTQIKGPNIAVILSHNTSTTNATGLTKGTYVFNLNVTDDSNNTASDQVFITVNQNKNQKPKADAGKDFEIELPENAVVLNGSASTDDLAIAKWKWARSANSSAMGKMLIKSDETPVMVLTDLSAGKYTFNLTVFDEQGLSDSDTVTFLVRPDAKLQYLVDMTVDVQTERLTEELYNVLREKIMLLLGDGFKLQVHSLKPDENSDKPIITFHVESANKELLAPNSVVHHLKQKLKVDKMILGFPVARLQTTVCHNNCSGHGVCNEKSRICECESFWMRDLMKVYFMSDEDSDCNWSIFYVVLGFLCFSALLVGLLWGLVYICYKWCSKHLNFSKPATYKLIEDTDDLLPSLASKKTNISDSDTDLDVVFETRSKNIGRSFESRNLHKVYRNSVLKPGRRVKT